MKGYRRLGGIVLGAGGDGWVGAIGEGFSGDMLFVFSSLQQ